MSKLPLDLSPTRAFSKIDVHELLARVVARGVQHGPPDGQRPPDHHGRHRLGLVLRRGPSASAPRAGGSRRPPAASCSTPHRYRRDRRPVAELARQGLVRSTRRPRLGNLVGVVPYRCAALDRVRPLGWYMAFGYDPLASLANRSFASPAPTLRQERATRREVARGLAADRLALDGRDRFALTDLGRAALAASRVNPDAEVVL